MKTKTMLMGILALGAAIGFMPGQAQARDNEYCREYTRTVYIGNRQQEAYGTACMQPNGDWKIVDDSDRDRVGQRFRSSDVNETVSYQPVQYYTYRPPVQRTRIVFISDNDRRGNNWRHDNRRWDRDRGHDRDWNKDRHHR